MPATTRQSRSTKQEIRKHKTKPLPSRITSPSRNGHTKQPPTVPVIDSPRLNAVPRLSSNVQTMPREMAEAFTAFLGKKLQEMNPDAPVTQLLADHGLMQFQPTVPTTPPPPSPLSGAFSVSTNMIGAYSANGECRDGGTPAAHPSRNGHANSHHPQSAPLPSRNGAASPSASGNPSSAPAQPESSTLPSPRYRVDPARGPSVFERVSVAEHLLEIVGVARILPNEAAQKYLERVRECLDNPQDPVERMHLDLIAASHQLTLKFHANAAGEDVSHDVAVAYAGAATQLLGGFTAMTKSLDSHRESRRGQAAKGKRPVKSGTSK